jgi:hypothetical protein
MLLLQNMHVQSTTHKHAPNSRVARFDDLPRCGRQRWEAPGVAARLGVRQNGAHEGCPPNDAAEADGEQHSRKQAKTGVGHLMNVRVCVCMFVCARVQLRACHASVSTCHSQFIPRKTQ